ncbi:MAG: response regulator transcription factor [Chloroflexi bacterium]|nr:response regulator transcription factor [Chloroflexota bacterium]
MGLGKRLVVFGRLQREGLELEASLQGRGFQVYVVEEEEELLDVVSYSQPDAVLVLGRTATPMLARLVAANQDGGRSLLVAVWPGIAVATAVELLDLGVDYVAGSYQPDWLAAQVRASLRRFGRDRASPSVIELGRLRIDLQQRRVSVDERDVNLTPTEFSVLRVLAERPGTVLPSGEIMQQVMGVRIPESEAQDILKVHIHRLRQKLESDGDERRFIRTVRGHGYMYAFERRSRERTLS